MNYLTLKGGTDIFIR